MFNISRCVCKFLFCPVISIMCVKKCTSLLWQNILFDWLNIIYNKAVLYASFINCTIHKMYIYVYVQMYIYIVLVSVSLVYSSSNYTAIFLFICSDGKSNDWRNTTPTAKAFSKRFANAAKGCYCGKRIWTNCIICSCWWRNWVMNTSTKAMHVCFKSFPIL